VSPLFPSASAPLHNPPYPLASDLMAGKVVDCHTIRFHRPTAFRPEKPPPIGKLETGRHSWPNNQRHLAPAKSFAFFLIYFIDRYISNLHEALATAELFHCAGSLRLLCLGLLPQNTHRRPGTKFKTKRKQKHLPIEPKNIDGVCPRLDDCSTTAK